MLDRCGRSGHGRCLGDSLFAVVVQAVFCLDPLFDAVVLSQILILLLFLVRGERVVETDRRSNDFLTLLLTRFLKKKTIVNISSDASKLINADRVFILAKSFIHLKLNADRLNKHQGFFKPKLGSFVKADLLFHLGGQIPF